MLKFFLPQTAGFIILACLMVFCVSRSHGQSPLGLDKCIEIAWENNLQLQQQRLSVDLAQENLLQSRASMFPSLNASVSHSYNFGRTVDPFTNEFATETIRSNNFGVSSGVNLFSGLQTQNTIRQSRYELEANKFDLDRSYNDIALMVASAYLNILFAKELLDIVESQADITRQQLDRTTRLVEAGTLPRGAILNIQAQLATEELQIVNAENQLDLAYLNLRQIMFLPEEEEFAIEIPVIDIDLQESTPYSPMQVYSVAVLNQPEVKSAEMRIMGAERGLAVARGGRSPVLSLRASYGTGYSEASLEIFDEVPTGLNQVLATDAGDPILVPLRNFLTRRKPFASQLEDNLSRSLGFFLTIPVFNNYQVRSNVSRSQINLENTRLQNQIIREQLFQTIQQAHADASAALKRYFATEKNVEALQESFRYTEQRFNVGMVNSVEYNDAKNRLTAAESELLQARYEYVFRMKILDFYLGEPLGFN